MHQDHGKAFALSVKKAYFVASLTQFVWDLPGSFTDCFSTFCQIVYQLPMNTELSLFGLYHVPKPKQMASLGDVTMSPNFWRCRKRVEESVVTGSSISRTNPDEMSPAGSLAVMLETELDESTRFRGWLQMRNDNPRHSQWSVAISDLPEDGVGWGCEFGWNYSRSNK